MSVSPPTTASMPLKARLRTWRQNAAWAVRDWFDRSVCPPAIERRLIGARRTATQPVVAPQPVRRLYVDVSVISRDDAGTGIQRVVRSIRMHLAEACADAVEIIPLIVERRRDGYRTLDGQPIAGGPDAIFFGLDFATDSIFRYRRDLAAFRRSGGRMWFLLHDILPISHPHWFTHASGVKYRRWLRTCAALADGFLCVSPVVRTLLTDLLRERYGLADGPAVVPISLGSDITASDRIQDAAALPLEPGLTKELFARAALIVGTLEPRKGHTDVLDAFDRLWTSGHDIPLVLIGRPGWNTDALQRRIRQHPRHGVLLFWLDRVDDTALRAAYGQCRIAIVPSLAEGYGLPLDEALALGAPVLARDIPVFQRHQATAIHYFPQTATDAEIASAVIAAHESALRTPDLPPLTRWQQTARQCVAAMGCARP